MESDTRCVSKGYPGISHGVGSNLLSLAIQSAWECGIERHVIARSCLYEEFLTNGFPIDTIRSNRIPSSMSKTDSVEVASNACRRKMDNTLAHIQSASSVAHEGDLTTTTLNDDHSNTTPTPPSVIEPSEMQELRPVADLADHLPDDGPIQTETLPESITSFEPKNGNSDQPYIPQSIEKTPVQVSTVAFSTDASNGWELATPDSETAEATGHSVEQETTTVEDILTGFCLANDIIDANGLPPKVHH